MDSLQDPIKTFAKKFCRHQCGPLVKGLEKEGIGKVNRIRYIDEVFPAANGTLEKVLALTEGTIFRHEESPSHQPINKHLKLTKHMRRN